MSLESAVSSPRISEEESQQLLRTVEMFEAILEHQPNDYQSLEILKEAYAKLARPEDALKTSKRLASAYKSLGQISQAILEYEGILQEYPSDPEAQKALEELEAKTSNLSATNAKNSKTPSKGADSKPSAPIPTPTPGPRASSSFPAGSSASFASSLADFLIAEKVITKQAVTPLLQKIAANNEAAAARGEPLVLLQLMVEEQLAKMDDLLGLLADKTGLPFLPLSEYDVDRETVCLLPRELCMQHCLIPFDMISRSVLIATTNPIDTALKTQVEQMLDYNIFWYITSPSEIVSHLRQIHGYDNQKGSKPAGAAS